MEGVNNYKRNGDWDRLCRVNESVIEIIKKFLSMFLQTLQVINHLFAQK